MSARSQKKTVVKSNNNIQTLLQTVRRIIYIITINLDWRAISKSLDNDQFFREKMVGDFPVNLPSILQIFGHFHRTVKYLLKLALFAEIFHFLKQKERGKFWTVFT